MTVHTYARSADREYYIEHPDVLRSYAQEMETRIQDILVDIEMLSKDISRYAATPVDAPFLWAEFKELEEAYKTAYEQRAKLEALLASNLSILWMQSEVKYKVILENYRVRIEYEL